MDLPIFSLKVFSDDGIVLFANQYSLKMRNLCKSKTNEQINVYLMLWRRGFLLNLCPVFLDKLGYLFPAKSDHFG